MSDQPVAKKKTGPKNPIPEGYVPDPPKVKRQGFGRPIEYDPNYCERVIELGKQGKSITAIAVDLGISKQTLYVWTETYKDFSDAISQARDAAMVFFEALASKHMVEKPGGPKVNTGLFTFTMKNRFRSEYGDQPQVIINKTDETKLNEDIKEKLDALESKIRNGNK